MSKTKYLITKDGVEVGFLVIEESAGVFEYTTPGGVAAITGGPAGDAALLFAALVGFTGTAWFIGGPAWLAPTIGLTVTAALAGVRAWRSGAMVSDDPAGQDVTIKIESWGDEGRVLLDEIRDKTIPLDAWRRTAKAVVLDGKNFSRPALAEAGRYISQPEYHKIKNELVRLNMAHRQGSRYILSPRGLAMLRKVVTLPY